MITAVGYYPVFLWDEKSIELLNGLFDHGWMLRSYDSRAFNHLAFRVPMGALESSAGRQIKAVATGRYAGGASVDQRQVMMVVLEPSRSGVRQMALKVQKDDRGNVRHKILQQVLSEHAVEWRMVTCVDLDRAFAVAIVQRDNR
jgi:hypothetical protein